MANLRFVVSLTERGAYVVSADKIVHQLLSTDTNLIQKVINLLGSDIVVKGQLDRSKIANKVFNHPKLLQDLESILHPAVRAEIDHEYLKAASDPQNTLFVAEIPLLFEVGDDKLFDATLVVAADPKICRERFVLETGNTSEEYDRRVARQWTLEEKMKKADFVIHNNGNKDQLKESINKLYPQLIHI